MNGKPILNALAGLVEWRFRFFASGPVPEPFLRKQQQQRARSHSPLLAF